MMEKSRSVEQEVGGSNPPNCTNKIKYLSKKWKVGRRRMHTSCTHAVNIRVFCSYAAAKAPADIAEVKALTAGQ